MYKESILAMMCLIYGVWPEAICDHVYVQRNMECSHVAWLNLQKEKYSERRVSRLCRLEHWEAGSVLSCMCGSKHWEVGSVVAFVWATKTRRRVLLEEPDIWIAQHSSVTVGGGKSGRDEFGAKDETSALGTQRRTYTQFFWLWIYEAMNDAWRTYTDFF